MKRKSLGSIAQDKWMSTSDRTIKHCWEPVAAAVVAEHERRKWRPMSTCPACAEEIIAGYRDGDEWIQTMGDARTLCTFAYYTHWQYAPEGP